MSPEDPTKRPQGPPHEALESRLRELRRLIRSSLALRAGSLLAAAASGLVLISLLLDRAFRLPLSGRAAAQAVYCGALAWLAWKLLLRPISRRLPDGALADLVERRFPQLLDRFRSAVEFARDPRVRGDTASTGREGTAAPADQPATVEDIAIVMKRRVVADAAADAAAIDPAEVVDTPGVVASLVGGVAAVATIAVIGALSSSSIVTWYRRNVLFEDVEWPYRTRLIVEGFDQKNRELGVPRGDPLRLRVRAEGEVPPRVRIRIAYAREALAFNLAREGVDAFVHEQAEVTESFELTVEGGDFRSLTHRVLVLERPDVERIRILTEPPAYTGKPVQTAEGDVGELSVPEGSRVQIHGSATKPLRRAWLETEGREIALSAGAREGIPPEAFSGAYEPRSGGTTTLHLEDEDKIPANRWFRFIVTPVPDRIPIVIARAEGIGSMITPNARIPFKVKATDDYGVVSIGVEHDAAAEKDALAKGSNLFPPLQAPGPVVEEEPAFEVGPLKIEPEKRLDLRIFARDNDGLHGSKTGYAATQSFLVVTPERLGEEFLRREEEQRRILERAVAEERAVRDASYRLIDEAWKAEGALPETAVKEMAGLARTERQIARQVTGITGAMRLLGDEMKNNRMGEEEELVRLVNAIIGPLTDIAERLIPQASSRIGAIREMGRAEDRLRDGLALAADLESIIQRMEAVLSSMKRLEGFTEVVNRLRGIIKIHEEAAGEAKKIYRREVDSIFEDPVPEKPGGPAPPSESK